MGLKRVVDMTERLSLSLFLIFHVTHVYVLVVQSLSCVRLFATPWTTAHQASLSFTISWSLLKLMPIESVMPIQPSHPLLSPSPSALNLSQYQGLF